MGSSKMRKEVVGGWEDSVGSLKSFQVIWIGLLTRVKLQGKWRSRQRIARHSREEIENSIGFESSLEDRLPC